MTSVGIVCQEQFGDDSGVTHLGGRRSGWKGHGDSKTAARLYLAVSLLKQTPLYFVIREFVTLLSGGQFFLGTRTIPKYEMSSRPKRPLKPQRGPIWGVYLFELYPPSRCA